MSVSFQNNRKAKRKIRKKNEKAKSIYDFKRRAQANLNTAIFKPKKLPDYLFNKKPKKSNKNLVQKFKDILHRK